MILLFQPGLIYDIVDKSWCVIVRFASPVLVSFWVLSKNLSWECWKRLFL